MLAWFELYMSEEWIVTCAYGDKIVPHSHETYMTGKKCHFCKMITHAQSAADHGGSRPHVWPTGGPAIPGPLLLWHLPQPTLLTFTGSHPYHPSSDPLTRVSFPAKIFLLCSVFHLECVIPLWFKKNSSKRIQGTHAISHIEYKVVDNRKYFNGPKQMICVFYFGI